MSQREDFTPGRKVRFAKTIDSKLWNVGNDTGVILATRAYGPSEAMITVEFDKRRVHVSHVQLVLVEQ